MLPVLKVRHGRRRPRRALTQCDIILAGQGGAAVLLQRAALLLRRGRGQASEVVQIGAFQFDNASHRVSLDGQPVAGELRIPFSFAPEGG